MNSPGASGAARPVLLRWTRFRSDHHGTGPEKRSAQIRHLAEAAGYEVADMVLPRTLSRTKAWLAGIPLRLRLGPCASVDRAGIGLLGYRSLAYRQALDAHRGAKVLLWETTYDDVLPALARARGFRIIALPHNLEALVSDAVFRDPAYDPAADLAAEVRRLGRADHVFTIAREERWLLEAGGVRAGYLPFVAMDGLLAECLRLREARETAARAGGSDPRPYLILGSAFNPATARGMRLQLEWITSLPAPPVSVIVVGPETDVHFAALASPNVQVLGAVPRARLVELLVQCVALLVHTEGGAGAVTRIPEALAAGVPVIANPNAARDQFGTPGVHMYSSPDEFAALVRSSLPFPPPPAAPEESFRRFGRAIAESLSQDSA